MAKTFIENDLIHIFENKEGPFNYAKLISFLNSLNRSYKDSEAYTCSVLIRAIIDTIPPLLGFITFNEVVNSYGWGETNSKYMKMLLDFKNDGDSTLHNQISEDKDFLGIDKITMFRNILNILLQECSKKGGKDELVKVRQQRQQNTVISPKINIILVEGKNEGWQNYAMGLYMGYSFKFVLSVDNFNSNKLDYLSLFLEAKDSLGEPWRSSHYIFESDKPEPNCPYLINPSEVKEVTVIVSDKEFSHSPTETRFKPNLDRDTLVLNVQTRSGKVFLLPIKAKIL